MAHGRTSLTGVLSLSCVQHTAELTAWATTYVGNPSAIGQPTRPTQPFILLEYPLFMSALVPCSSQDR